MRVVNNTTYRTDHLRAFIQRVAETEAEPLLRRQLRVTVQYKRRGARVCGRAGIHSNWMLLLMDKDDQDKCLLASIIAHEFAHCRGVEHTEMRGPRYTYEEGWRELYAWANALPLERKTAPLKPDASMLVSRKLAHAQASLARWVRKSKTARTIERKWRQKVRYYERRMAAMKGTARLA